ncbi:MAG TPA: hypothetical protein VIT44_06860 [Cyclobacteriaceae bacterium]
MKRYIFNINWAFTLLALITFVSRLEAQQASTVRKWFVPDHVVVQYAGSIGFISGGAGYDLFKTKNANLDFLFGHVPRFTGSKAINSITLKFNALPIRVVINERTTLYPLTAGAYICYTPGNAYTSRLPSWYPDGYYWWSEAIRANLFIGGSVNFSLQGMKEKSRLTAYYELGTNEIKLVSYVQNLHELSIWNIVHGGFGFRYHF